jgi:subtilase family serine protease
MRLADSSLTIPSAVSGVVAGALGINQYVATPADAGDPDIPGSSTSTPAATGSGVFPPAPAAFITHAPCSPYYGANTTTVSPSFGNGFPDTVPDIVCGYRPGQLRSAYGLTSANTGAGTTVAVVDAYGSATIGSDATRYFAATAPSEPFAAADFTQIDQTPFDDETDCQAPGWATEQAIDVEAVHSMAPDAHILYVGAQDCITGLFTADQTVIDNGLANVVTNSWGDLGGDLLDDIATRSAYDDLFMLADSTGITVQFSSGDDGDDFYLLGVSAAEYPASSPFVTAVGGTTLEIGANGQRLGELGWDVGRSILCTANLAGDLPGCTSSTVGTWLPASPDGISGGYTSYNYTQPFYQQAVVPTLLAERNAPFIGPVPTRVVPDISAEADSGTGFLIGLHQMLPDGLSLYTETRYGGTSLASPLLAGIVADADQVSGTPVGFINPALYKMDTEAPGSIMDIVPTADNEGNFREDFAGALGLGINNGTTYATGVAESYRELGYSGLETYCDDTGNCASRPEPLTTAPGYDSLTGLGSPGTNFINILGEY